MLPDLTGELYFREQVLGSEPDGHSLWGACKIVRAQTLKCGFQELSISLLGRKFVDAAIDDPAALLPDPGLLLGQFKHQVQELSPLVEWSVGLEQNGGLDDSLSTKQTTEIVVSLFL